MSAKKKARVVPDKPVELDETPEPNMISYQASADATAEFKTSKKTKSTYKSHVNRYKEFCKVFDLNSLDSEGEVKIPIEWDTVKGFIGKTVEPANKRYEYSCPEDIPKTMRQPYSASNLGGFKSAIVDLYTRKRMKLDDRTNAEWEAEIGIL